MAAAAQAADRLGMAAPGRDAPGPGPHEPAFRREGQQWTLSFAGRAVRMRDAKGLHDIAALLASPGMPVAAVELAGSAPLGADEVLDERARRELRARLAELEETIEEAEGWADQARAAKARDERAQLLGALAAATGLGGRARRLGDESERARKTVTARIRDVIARIERVHPALGAHLRASITTGTACAYSPPSPTSWAL
jgi:hypothetical protein